MLSANRFSNLLLFLLGAAPACVAGTFTITSTDDSGPGTLREAIAQVNASPGPHRIEFNLSGNGVHTISPLTALPTIVNEVTIDGYSQPGSKTNALQWGSDAVLLVRLDGVNATNGLNAGLTLSASRSTVRGLIIVRFAQGLVLKGSYNVIAGNWIGIDFDGIARGQTFNGIDVNGMGFATAMHNVIGGEPSGDRNVIGGNSVGISFFPELASQNSVIGNFIGTDPSGRLRRGNLSEGVSVQGATNIQVIGNVVAATANSGGPGIRLLSTSGIVIRRNLIGLSVDFGDLGNAGSGIFAQGVNGLEIGGASDSTDGNRIGCNAGSGIEFLGCSGATIRGNVIGTGSSGAEPFGNLGYGILLTASSTNQIGPGNEIVYSRRGGVGVASGTANEITANYIYDNGGLAIDLGNDGLTFNDPGDADTGANQLQNYPVLLAAEANGGSLLITGSLQSEPATTYRIEFFASWPWDPYWIPEGQVFLGSTIVTTDASGNCDFNFSCPDPAWLTEDDVVTATATDPAGNTSEFSAAAAVSIQGRPPSLSVSLIGNSVRVNWPSAATTAGFQLESASSPDQNVPWEKITNFNNDGTTCSFLLPEPVSGTAWFFRLRK